MEKGPPPLLLLLPPLSPDEPPLPPCAHETALAASKIDASAPPAIREALTMGLRSSG